MSTKNLKGLRQNSRSPGSIHNAEHHDVTGSSKSLVGQPLAIERIMTDSTAATTPDNSVRNHGTLRIFNTDGLVQYIWAGKEDEIPATVDATTGLAIAPGTSEVMFVGYSDDDKKSIVVKTSSSAVQVAVIEG